MEKLKQTLEKLKKETHSMEIAIRIYNYQDGGVKEAEIKKAVETLAAKLSKGDTRVNVEFKANTYFKKE